MSRGLPSKSSLPHPVHPPYVSSNHRYNHPPEAHGRLGAPHTTNTTLTPRRPSAPPERTLLLSRHVSICPVHDEIILEATRWRPTEIVA